MNSDSDSRLQAPKILTPTPTPTPDSYPKDIPTPTPTPAKNLSFGKCPSPLHCLKLNGSPIDWVEKWRYLGVSLIHGPRFGCCIDDAVRKFYRAANSILRVDGRSNDLVMLSLLETHCVPVLSYDIEVIHVADKKKQSKMRVAYNSIFRKLFCYSWRESVTNLQHSLGRPTWEELMLKRKTKFADNLASFPNDSLVSVICAS